MPSHMQQSKSQSQGSQSQMLHLPLNHGKRPQMQTKIEDLQIMHRYQTSAIYINNHSLFYYKIAFDLLLSTTLLYTAMALCVGKTSFWFYVLYGQRAPMNMSHGSYATRLKSNNLYALDRGNCFPYKLDGLKVITFDSGSRSYSKLH